MDTTIELVFTCGPDRVALQALVVSAILVLAAGGVALALRAGNGGMRAGIARARPVIYVPFFPGHPQPARRSAP